MLVDFYELFRCEKVKYKYISQNVYTKNTGVCFNINKVYNKIHIGRPIMLNQKTIDIIKVQYSIKKNMD